jgi:hypothetical protein
VVHASVDGAERGTRIRWQALSLAEPRLLLVGRPTQHGVERRLQLRTQLVQAAA